MRLPLRQKDTYRDAEDEPGHREPDRCVTAVRGDEVQDEDRPERETHHATGGEETDAEGCIRRLCASDRRPDGMESRGPEPAVTSKTKTSQSSEATPIRLKNVDAIKTPTHPITRNPMSSPSAPKTGCVTEEAIQNTPTITARIVGPASNRS